MIPILLRKIMKAKRLTRQQLADVMGVDWKRVKNLCDNHAKKLTREEGEALIRKLHVRGDWLMTGEGPMFQSEGEQAFICAPCARCAQRDGSAKPDCTAAAATTIDVAAETCGDDQPNWFVRMLARLLHPVVCEILRQQRGA